MHWGIPLGWKGAILPGQWRNKPGGLFGRDERSGYFRRGETFFPSAGAETLLFLREFYVQAY